MKPFKEHVLTTPSFDWLVREFRCREHNDQYACSWHYHSEYELVLYLDPHSVFQGNYYAGDAIGEIVDHTLLLYGPGLPHMLAGKSVASENSEQHTVIIWFSQHWVDQLQHLVPEARHLSRLLSQAAHGLHFSPEIAQKVANIMEGCIHLPRHHQVVKVIDVLLTLADDLKATKLCTSPYRIQPFSSQHDTDRRIELATHYIEQHYAQSITMAALCQTLHMSESSAYRLFEKHYGVSFSEHLKQYRVGKACELLASTRLPIALVAERTGFKNLSNFNRQFKGVKAMTPSEFRQQFISPLTLKSSP